MRNSIVTILIASVVCLVMACGGSKSADSLTRGIDFFDARDYEMARVELEAARATEPADAMAVAYLGRVASRQDDYDAAIELLEEAVTLEDTNADFHLWLAQAYFQKVNKVPMMQKQAPAARGKDELMKAVQLDETHVEARVFLASFYLQAPPIAGGSVPLAKKLCKQLIALDPVQGHTLMARALVQEKDFAGAEKELQILIELDPDNPDAHFRLGRHYQDTDKWEQAFESFEQAVALDPGHAGSLYQIGRTGVFAGTRLDRSIECLQMFMKLDPPENGPSWSHAQWRLGMLYEKKGDPAMARAAYTRAVELDSTNKQAREALEALDAASQ